MACKGLLILNTVANITKLNTVGYRYTWIGVLVTFDSYKLELHSNTMHHNNNGNVPHGLSLKIYRYPYVFVIVTEGGLA